MMPPHIILERKDANVAFKFWLFTRVLQLDHVERAARPLNRRGNSKNEPAARSTFAVSAKLVFTALLIILLIYWATTYRNEVHAQNGEKWALLVGIDDYDDEKIVDLDYAISDVTAFRNALLDPNEGGFSNAHIYMMTDKSSGDLRPTHTNILFRLKKLVEVIKPEDTFIFYFSGRRLTRDGKSFLLTVNADSRELDTLELTTIPVERLHQYMRKIRARQSLFILDACRNDRGTGEDEFDNHLAEQLIPKPSQEKLVPLKPSKTIIGKDGAEMGLIPAGGFLMEGSDSDEDHESPSTVYLDAFYMDKYEVTNARYAKFLNEYGKTTDVAGNELIDLADRDCLIEKNGNTYRPRNGYENHPVVEVTWYGATAYAQFYNKRLPTEAEWEKAARGGLIGKKYPWGDEPDSTKANYNYDGLRGWRGLLMYLEPVGSFPPNGYDLYDMVGNVFEWCSVSDEEDYQVCCGGSWDLNESYMHLSYRYGTKPSSSSANTGFRCVVSSLSIP